MSPPCLAAVLLCTSRAAWPCGNARKVPVCRDAELHWALKQSLLDEPGAGQGRRGAPSPTPAKQQAAEGLASLASVAADAQEQDDLRRAIEASLAEQQAAAGWEAGDSALPAAILEPEAPEQAGPRGSGLDELVPQRGLESPAPPSPVRAAWQLVPPPGCAGRLVLRRGSDAPLRVLRSFLWRTTSCRGAARDHRASRHRSCSREP